MSLGQMSLEQMSSGADVFWANVSPILTAPHKKKKCCVHNVSPGGFTLGCFFACVFVPQIEGIQIARRYHASICVLQHRARTKMSA
jgi:hypothetical protein